MLSDIINGNFNIFQLVVYVIVLFTVLPFHEFAHAWTANKLGDPTATFQGRNTLNPLKHLDPFGTICILLTGFGWAKPVPVNPVNFRKVTMRTGMALTSFAGPAANLIFAVGAMILSKLAAGFAVMSYSVAALANTLIIAANVFYLMALVSTGLAVFNLIPIPPLDGSKILNAVLPDRIYFKIMQYERYIFIGLMLLMVSGALDVPLSFLREWAFTGIYFITGFVDIIFKAVGVY